MPTAQHPTIIAYGNKHPQRREFDYDWLHHHGMSHTSRGRPEKASR
jgi:hypothetical protein